MTLEKWRPIAGCRNYHVSSLGRVIGPRGILSHEIDKDGYHRVTAAGSHKLVHRLVAQAFVENPDLKPQVNHKDANKDNNCADNLEWATPIENIAHSARLGLQKRHPSSYDARRKISEQRAIAIIRMYNDGEPIVRIHKRLGLSYATVKDIATRKTWKHLEVAA